MPAVWCTSGCATFVSCDHPISSQRIAWLTHTDALNRFPLRPSSEHPESADDNDKSKVHSDVDSTTRIMMYMFPRQFGLHNVFTSHVDMSKTAQKLQDYTLREEEIFEKFHKTTDGDKPRLDVRVPKRLRGELEHLVQRLQALHARCSYAQLLQHYCPVRGLRNHVAHWKLTQR